jgi:hypothetical protein
MTFAGKPKKGSTMEITKLNQVKHLPNVLEDVDEDHNQWMMNQCVDHE